MYRLARPIVTILFLLVPAGLAAAVAQTGDEPPVVRALLDAAAVNAAARPTYASLDVAPDGTITLTGLTATYQAGDDAETAMSYAVETLVLADVTQFGVGVFEVGDAQWRRVTLASGEDEIAAIPLITAQSLYIHQPAEEPTPLERLRASNVLAESFAIPEAAVLAGGESIVLEDLSGTWEGDPMTGAGTSRFTARRIDVPGAVFGGEENPLAMAGYGKLELAIEGTSTTTYTDAAAGFDLELRIDGRDVGRLIVALGADGIPLALVGALDADDPDPDAFLGFADEVSLKRARIRFEDASLTGRLLSLAAEVEGTDVASLVADGTADIETTLAGMLEPKIAREVAEAITAYLNDPQSITIALSPAQPVRFAQVMAGLESPAALITLLQLRVTAND